MKKYLCVCVYTCIYIYVCMYVYIYIYVCMYVCMYIYAKWAAVFLNCSFYQFAFWTQYLVKIILPLLFPPFSAILFPWGNRQNDIHRLFAFLTHFLSSGLSSQNNQSEMNDLCPCQCQVISLWKHSRLRLLPPMCYESSPAVMARTVEFWVLMVILRLCSRVPTLQLVSEEVKFPQGPDLIFKLPLAGWPMRLRTDPSILIYCNLYGSMSKETAPIVNSL